VVPLANCSVGTVPLDSSVGVVSAGFSSSFFFSSSRKKILAPRKENLNN